MTVYIILNTATMGRDAIESIFFDEELAIKYCNSLNEMHDVFIVVSSIVCDK